VFNWPRSAPVIAKGRYQSHSECSYASPSEDLAAALDGCSGPGLDEQRYDRTGDAPRFNQAIASAGIEAAVRTIADRDVEQGTRFNYANPQTAALAAVLRGATRTSLSHYLTPRLWQAIGAEDSAAWYADRTGLEVAAGNFNATLRDYARLGVVLANDGVRPDDPTGKQIVAREFLLDATDWTRGRRAFRPGKATPYWGSLWTAPPRHQRHHRDVLSTRCPS